MVLTIEKIGSSAEQVRYYATLGRGDYRHEYYSEGHRAGTWWGSAAKKLGLDGPVEEQTFRNILLGKNENGTQTLVAPPKDPTKERRCGWDLTLTVPKSVSVAYSQADKEGREEIVELCEKVLDRWLSLFDEMCGVTRRGHNGATQEKAGLVAAIFRHDTARPVSGDAPGEILKPDPNLHWHVVLCNLTAREDGTFGAFSGSEMYRRGMKLALGTLFRVELSRELREYGLETYRPAKENGRGEKVSHFELKAVPKKLLDEMSKRRKAVEKWLQKHGLRGWRASQKGTLATREKKKAFTQEELDYEWKQLGKKHGFTNQELVRARKQFGQVDEPQVSRKCLERGIARLGKEKSRFSFLEILKITAEEGQATGVGLRDIQAVVDDALLYSQELVKLRDVEGEKQWTTKENLLIEKRLLASAKRLNQQAEHSADYSEVAIVLKGYSTMRAEQRAAVRHMCVGSSLSVVNGISGSGKTYALKAAREVWESRGLKVLGTTLAAKTAERLEKESGIESIYCHKLLRAIEMKDAAIDSSTVLVIEEAGMIDTRTMEVLFRHVELGGGKVVLTGDHTQLAAIDAGAPMRVIAEREGVTELQEIIRQKKPEDREMVRDLREGRSGKVIQERLERDLLHIADHRDDALEQLVSDWKKRAIDDGELAESLILTGTNAAVRELNSLCQEERRKAGELSYGKVETEECDFHVGDIVMARKNHHPLMIKNGMTGTVTGVVDEKTVRVRFHGGYQVEIDVTDYTHLSLGYAASVHTYQGASADYSFYLLDEQMTSREEAYVGGSRHRKEARFYTDYFSAGETLEELAWQLERSRGKDMAVEHLPEQTMEMM